MTDKDRKAEFERSVRVGERLMELEDVIRLEFAGVHPDDVEYEMGPEDIARWLIQTLEREGLIPERPSDKG